MRGPVRRRPPMPVVRSPPREQQRPQQQQEPKQQQQQQPSAAASAPSAAPWDAVDASAPPGIQQQQQPPEASAGASSGAAAVPQGSAATGSSGAASAGPRAPGKASGLDALMSAARGQAKAARAGQPQALAPAEMAAVAQRWVAGCHKILASSGAAVAGSCFVWTAAALPTCTLPHLLVCRRPQTTPRNQAAVGAALQAAAREGRQPRLSELLVEPSWVEVRAVPRRSAPVDGACAQVGWRQGGERDSGVAAGGRGVANASLLCERSGAPVPLRPAPHYTRILKAAPAPTRRSWARSCPSRTRPSCSPFWRASGRRTACTHQRSPYSGAHPHTMRGALWPRCTRSVVAASLQNRLLRDAFWLVRLHSAGRPWCSSVWECAGAGPRVSSGAPA